ncbi:tRNA-specific adenosine deaminase subunit TAD2 [Podospora aff. communis PSN243]|uniref:tRNA-specific adenosine deaminase subunit TAD2 n=1 Tax=Podospora aff. communis PSN243 TaxID=3040156 RepID=A0AAV9G8J6_9PEZI|nr:tRNA-specific adenosine deaminase subunit TAD2 [Podospora aff. communis PSN243]
MAVAPSPPVSAAGRRVLAFFKSVFALVVDAIRRIFRSALHFFPSYFLNSSPPPTNGPREQTDLCSATNSSAPQNPAASSEVPADAAVSPIDKPADANGNTTMPAASSSSAAPGAPATRSLPQKVPVPKITPALPLVPLQPRNQNAAPKPAGPTPPVATSSTAPLASGVEPTLAQIASHLTRLRMDGGPGSEPLSPSLQPQRPNENGTSKENIPRPSSQPPAIISDPVGAAMLAELLNSAPREVVRAPAVPMHHGVSQTSKLKETTTIAVGEDSVHIQARSETPEEAAERLRHGTFMREALDMARLALKTNETPVGCVLVYNDRVIAKGMNATNVSRNGTRHAELMAICALLSYSPASDTEPSNSSSPVKPSAASMPLGTRTNQARAPRAETSAWGDVDPRDGHLYPYGQKLHPSPRVNKSIITDCVLYVTVEPCVMCASLLRQLGIKKVYFGAVNDKFGGTGGVFRIHQNSPYTAMAPPPLPTSQEGKGVAKMVVEQRSVSPNAPAPDEQAAVGSVSNDAPLSGDGGNVERGYEAEGGWGRDEAVTLLRQFYVQENGRAPVPRKKEGRAARLAMMMQRDGHAGGPMIDPSVIENAQENSESDTAPENSPTAETAEMAAAEKGEAPLSSEALSKP